MFKNPIIDFNALFNSLGNSTYSSPEVILAFLLYEGNTIHNASDQFVSCVYFFFVDFTFHPSPQTKIGSVCTNFKPTISTPTENWTHVYMNLFTRNSPYYHHLKYLLFLLKHPVYYFNTMFYTTRKEWNKMYQFYVQCHQVVSYLLLVIDNILQVVSICNIQS